MLFALGLGLAVVRRDRLSIFFLCLLVTGLMGGILTLDFEAPQSLRSIGALPAVIYFIALSLTHSGSSYGGRLASPAPVTVWRW